VCMPLNNRLLGER